MQDIGTHYILYNKDDQIRSQILLERKKKKIKIIVYTKRVYSVDMQHAYAHCVYVMYVLHTHTLYSLDATFASTHRDDYMV